MYSVYVSMVHPPLWYNLITLMYSVYVLIYYIFTLHPTGFRSTPTTHENPYPYPPKPVPVVVGMGFHGYGYGFLGDTRGLPVIPSGNWLLGSSKPTH
jgi:hypothetical protein